MQLAKKVYHKSAERASALRNKVFANCEMRLGADGGFCYTARHANHLVVSCEALRPTLSSIATDVVAMRDEDLRLLERLIAGEPPACRHVTVKPLGVVRRASTLRAAKNDPAVLAACELIRQKACEGLKARDVAAIFPCGRRMAEIRFRAALGHSILDEIRAVRRRRAQMAVQPFRTQLRDEVAALCGYSSWSSVHRLLSR